MTNGPGRPGSLTPLPCPDRPAQAAVSNCRPSANTPFSYRPQFRLS